MKTKIFALRIAGTIFGIVAVVHLLRIITGASLIVAECAIPIWVNILGFIATGYLCGWFWWLTTRKTGSM